VTDVRAKFFREHRDLWSKWVTAEAATRIDAALK
jgi:glycine betaine/proline transport system substrate-binding protein